MCNDAFIVSCIYVNPTLHKVANKLIFNLYILGEITFILLKVREALVLLFRYYKWNRAAMISPDGDTGICEMGAKAIYNGGLYCHFRF